MHAIKSPFLHVASRNRNDVNENYMNRKRVRRDLLSLKSTNHPEMKKRTKITTKYNVKGAMVKRDLRSHKSTNVISSSHNDHLYII